METVEWMRVIHPLYFSQKHARRHLPPGVYFCFLTHALTHLSISKSLAKGEAF